ncbi:hypothetical protein [Streptomyces sp. NPDC045714]|uniref:hypothetical protein n=1 Tax=Streptomyces sp. NPDC045714 TaxID=3154913 RepID=UPI00340FC463
MLAWDVRPDNELVRLDETVWRTLRDASLRGWIAVRPGCWRLAPYLLWVGYAAALDLALWLTN